MSKFLILCPSPWRLYKNNATTNTGRLYKNNATTNTGDTNKLY
jgi:hypothetical protein